MIVCTRCNGTMEGDGYTSVLRCENACEADYEFHEPDAGPVYCRPSEEPSWRFNEPRVEGIGWEFNEPRTEEAE